MNKTHWKKWNNPDYLGSYAFQPGEVKVVTIKEVRREVVQNQQGKEECTVAHFEGDVKPLILNTTNCKTIAKVWGTPYVEDWVGKQIALKVKKVSAFGDMVDAVRVSTERPVDEEVVCEECGAAVTSKIAGVTKAKYGQILCVDCAKAKKEAKNG